MYCNLPVTADATDVKYWGPSIDDGWIDGWVGGWMNG